MSVFVDKKFEELDWISQATEPIDSELNEYLNQLPDELVIDFSLFNKMNDTHGFYSRPSISTSRALMYLLKDSEKYKFQNLNSDYRDQLENCFEFETTGNLVVNYETKAIEGGELKLIKVKSTLDEEVLKDMLGSNGIREVSYMSYASSSIGRMNEILELLEKCEQGLRTRSPRKKRQALLHRLKSLFETNEWNIRDTTLADKVGFWIKDYIVYGNLAALSNFCRIKVMTHKGQPIYSMEEVE